MAGTRQVQTNYKNAVDFIDECNRWLTKFDTKDDDGNPAAFSELAGSPVWLFALAHGKMMTEWQENLRDAENELDINTCSDDKVLVWATIAGITRKTGSPSRLVVSCLNSNHNDITVTSASVWQDAQNGSYWAVERDFTVPADSAETALGSLINMQDGAVNLSIGTTLTNQNFPAITMQVSGCTVGSGTETIAQLRNRILSGDARTDPVTNAQRAIAALPGIIRCSVFCNPSNNLPMTLRGGLVLQPRNAFIAIQGVDTTNKLAETFYSYMNVPTQQFEDSLHTTYSRGVLPVDVYYSQVQTQVIYVRVYVAAGTLASGQDLTIKRALLLRTNIIDIGGTLTEVMIAGWLSDMSGVTIQSIDLSSDGSVWVDYLQTDADKVPTWTADTITIIER